MRPVDLDWRNVDSVLKLISMIAAVAISNGATKAARTSSLLILAALVGTGLFLSAEFKQGKTMTTIIAASGVGAAGLGRALKGRKPSDSHDDKPEG